MKPREPVGRIHPVAHGPKASEDPTTEPDDVEVSPLDDAYDDVPCTD